MSPTRQFVLVGASFAAPPLHASDFNRLAYNPEVTYLPPIMDTACRSRHPAPTPTATTARRSALFNSASVDARPVLRVRDARRTMWAATRRTTSGSRSLVPLYCNTDWPALVNDVYWPGGPNGATVLDAGDSNGQYSAGTGGWCRINGTKYDVVGGRRARPAVQDDYNYPYNSSSGATGAQYFFRSVGTKTLWCDKTSPYCPRNSTITAARGGTPSLHRRRSADLRHAIGTHLRQRLAQDVQPGRVQPGRRSAMAAPASGAPAGRPPGDGHAAASARTAAASPTRRRRTGAEVQPARASRASPTATARTSRTRSRAAAAAPRSTRLASAACTGSPNGVMWDPVANAPRHDHPARRRQRPRASCAATTTSRTPSARCVPGVANVSRARTSTTSIPPTSGEAPAVGQFTTAGDDAAVRRSPPPSRSRATTTWSTRCSSATTASSPPTRSGRASAPACASPTTTSPASRK